MNRDGLVKGGAKTLAAKYLSTSLFRRVGVILQRLLHPKRKKSRKPRYMRFGFARVARCSGLVKG
jgi:hypothetical protein